MVVQLLCVCPSENSTQYGGSVNGYREFAVASFLAEQRKVRAGQEFAMVQREYGDLEP